MPGEDMGACGKGVLEDGPNGRLVPGMACHAI
jgi:hypothetical protein